MDLFKKTSGKYILQICFHQWTSIIYLDVIATCTKKLWLGYKVRFFTHKRITNYLNTFRKNIPKYLKYYKKLCKTKIMKILHTYYDKLKHLKSIQLNEVSYKKAFRKLLSIKLVNSENKKKNLIISKYCNKQLLKRYIKIWKRIVHIINKRNKKIKFIQRNILRSYMYILYNPLKLFYSNCYYLNNFVWIRLL